MYIKLKKAIKNNKLVWKYYRNRKATGSYKPYLLDQELSMALSELKQNGIAFTNFIQLFPDIDFDMFCQEVYKEVEFYEKGEMKKENNQKAYFNFVLGLNPTFDSRSVWNKISSHSNLQKLSDSYFRMRNTEMRYYNIWKHLASKEKPKGSQLWHRDREDLKILKVFICIEDVDIRRGPFTYALGTHLDGRVKKKPESFDEAGTDRTTDEMMSEVVPRKNWIQATGEKGTVIIADTHGYHKGGEVSDGYRLLFTTMYVSPACGRHYFR